MTKATKATASTKTETIADNAEAIDASETAATSVKKAGNLFSAVFQSGRSAVEGIIEVDKALLGFAKDAFNGYVDLGKKSMQAKCINDLIDLQAAHAHASIENGAANAREIVELSRSKAKEAYAPVKEIQGSIFPAKAA